MDYRTEAAKARFLNCIDMAVGFTATLRVFERGSGIVIKTMLRKAVEGLASIRSRADFEEVHARFCARFAKSIRLSKVEANASYGHGGKMLDVGLKACVHYCSLPSPDAARRLRPLLHAAIDTPILNHLKRTQHVPIAATTIGEIGEAEYCLLQIAVGKEIAGSFGGRVLPVEFDDMLWRRLNRNS